MTMTINEIFERERAILFFDKKIEVHVSKTDGRFYNGLIIEIGDNWFFIKDRRTNKKEMIFFKELKKPIQIFEDDKKGVGE